jgi:cation diffusion facilitator CzcD-associated flavoprotein CzcO
MYAIDYSTATGRALRFIKFDVSTELDPHVLRPGETRLIVTDGDMAASGPQSLVTAATGKIPTNDRFAELDESGNVVSTTIIDTALDLPSQPPGRYKAHPSAGRGWRNEGTQWFKATPARVAPRRLPRSRTAPPRIPPPR